MDIERDLLLGLLAIQEGYINLDQYTTACKIWAAEKARPLGEVLQSSGWINASVRAALENSVAGRLAAGPQTIVTVTPDAGMTTLQVGNATVDLPLTPKLAPTHVDPERNLGNPGAATLMVPEDNAPADCESDLTTPRNRSGSRYTLFNVHGEGGLGRIWRARDNDLNRDVALKEIQPKLADSEAKIRRFLLEAQVTGQLEHPNIVPVYELGYRPQDGQPFYTMRFVRGKTLSATIAEYHRGRKAKTIGRLDLARMFSRFYGVCYAVAYAHSRGVIHRDLKPDNVVLGDFAEVNLLDWGLAKLVEVEEDSSESSIRLSPAAASCEEGKGGIEGTPAYMAPEQIDARFGPIGTHSDIYGLGSILFEVLTGYPPHRGTSTLQLLDQIVRDETPLARKVELSVHPALEAICAKAMAKDYNKRYQKASEIALDVQRFMNDEPVTAYREPPLERMGRWARRHRTWTQAAAVALVIVSIVSIFATVLITGARQAEAVAMREAEGRYEQARGFADTLLVGVSEDLKDVPGAEGVQKKLLEKAAGAYQGFAGERSTDPGLQLKSGQALLRLAEVKNLLHDLDGAVEACRKAEAFFEALAATQRDSQIPVRWLAESRAMWGRVLNNSGKNTEALVPYQKAMSDFDSIVKHAPHNAEILDRRAFCALGKALVLQELDRLDESEKTYLAALDDYNHIINDAEASHLAGVAPEAAVNPAYRSNRARGLINLTTLVDQQAGKKGADQQRRKKDAEEKCRAAISDLEILVRLHADVPEYLYLLAASRSNLGNYLRDPESNDPAREREAQATFTESIDRYETLVFKKTIPKYIFGLIRARVSHATLLAKSNATVAEAMLRSAISPSQILVRVHPGDPSYLEALGDSEYELGMLLRADETKRSEAVDAFTQAIKIWRDVKATGLLSIGSGEKYALVARSKLRASLFWRCLTSLDMKRLEAAIADLKEFPTLFPDDVDDQYNAACCWSRAFAMTDDPAKKRQYAEHAVELLLHAITLDATLAPKITDGTSPKHDTDLDPIRGLPAFQTLSKPPKP